VKTRRQEREGGGGGGEGEASLRCSAVEARCVLLILPGLVCLSPAGRRARAASVHGGLHHQAEYIHLEGRRAERERERGGERERETERERERERLQCI